MSVAELQNILILYRYSDNAPSRPNSPLLSAERAAGFQRYVFPVVPSSYRVTMNRDVIEVPLLALGTTVRPGGGQPLELSFETFLPDLSRHKHASWLTPGYTAVSPWGAVRMLRDWQLADPRTGKTSTRERGMTPLRVTVSHTDGFLDFWCVMTSFEGEIKGAEVGDVSINITLREMVPLPRIRTPRRGINGQNRPTNRVTGKKIPAKVKTKARETLHQVCKRVYGTASREVFVPLYQANKGKIGPNYLRRLPAGIVLRVPRPTTVNTSSKSRAEK